MAAHSYEYVSPGPTVDRLLFSDSFIIGIRGPLGSGKTSGGVMKILEIAKKQQPQKDGRRYSRFAVIRNTYPELTTTTIKSWHHWVPESLGHWKSQGPPTHRIIDSNIDMEVIFVSLDRPKDVRKVLGMELTGALIDEAREVDKPLIDGLTGRVGRFRPPKTVERDDYECVSPQIIMSTNPPEQDHWWYVLAEGDTTTPRNEELNKSVRDAEEAMRKTIVNGKPLLGRNQKLFEFLAQPDANGPDAENLANLPPGYYQRLAAGKSEEWKKVYIRGEYGFVQDGRPVYPEFREHQHVKLFELNPKLPITIGIDFGNTPAATIGQRSFTGIQRARWEVVSEHMGALQFSKVLRGFLNHTCANFNIESITGDPAGDSEAQTDLQVPFKIMAANGIDVKPAYTQDSTLRRESVAHKMTELIDGEAAWQVHPVGCPVLRAGTAGKYRYRRVQIVGSEQYHLKPDKNMHSHVCEAEQYRLIGMGEGKTVLRGTLGGKRSRPAYSIT
jgi:hypothetical protein